MSEWIEDIAKGLGYVLLIGLMICAVALLFSIPTWLLWNWLMPTIFGLKEITLLQSLGLLLLTGLLFNRSSSKSKE